MVPTPEERVAKVETAVLALAKHVFANAQFDPSKHPRKGGKFTAKGGGDVLKKAAATVAKHVADTNTTIRGQNALPRKAAGGAAKKGAAKKAAPKADEKKFMEERAASAKVAADKAAAVAAQAAAGKPPTVAQAQAVVDEAKLMLDQAKANNAPGSATIADAVAGDVQMDNPDVEESEGFAGATLSTEQAAALKSVVQGYLAKESSGEPGAKQASMAASWASAAAVKGGPILQKVQDERDRMDAIAADKNETELRRAQARAISTAYKEVLKNVDY